MDLIDQIREIIEEGNLDGILDRIEAVLGVPEHVAFERRKERQRCSALCREKFAHPRTGVMVSKSASRCAQEIDALADVEPDQ